ncbi:MAG: alpha-amylase family glycosyl hydrolase [Pseudomonadota bacterium]|nr:alpha-amylase family glycosyl hydrolase [Pseudomonadota bacterium]
MADTEWVREHAEISLERILPRIQEQFKGKAEAADWQVFEERLRREWQRLFGLLVPLYGSQYDFFYHLEQIVASAARYWIDRPRSLKDLDEKREANPQWFQSQKMIGGVLYIDQFAGNLANLKEHIGYFRELGLTYLHLMPPFAVPEGNSDGGYAVSSYRHIRPDLGTMEEMAEFAALLREEGISLTLDFVYNHTSDEHLWARRAQAGEKKYQGYYYMFPDRTIPDQYERTLREIFPTIRRGSFTWREDMRLWVWTTFNSFQWDLNYANPEVFRAMAEEMLFLANNGLEILRLDAVAFLWKRMGTGCENLPEAHMIIQAFNALCRIAAPAVLFKSEAIVHPDEVIKYISPGEAQLSYNPLLMALLWEALATREVKLLAHSMNSRSKIPPGTSWCNYLRCHDDIGWTFDDGDAWHLGINGYDHRQFLNRFYTGQFPGSFSRGVPFQFNPDTGDMRISGTLASLAGLERAMHNNDREQIDLAVGRILMLHSIILSIGGIPLLYLGDEVAMLNDYSYIADPDKADDSRWVHRPKTNWEALNQRNDTHTPFGRVFKGLTHLIHLRKEQPALWDCRMDVIETGNPHLFGFTRNHGGQRLLVINNFSEQPQTMDANRLRVYGLGYSFHDVVSGQSYSAEEALRLEPYQFVWLDAGRQVG